MERHLVCCGCGHEEVSERLNCPKCNCEVEINLEYYLNHISELEGVYIKYKDKSPVLEKLTQSQLIQRIHGYQDKIAELEGDLSDQSEIVQREWASPMEVVGMKKRITELEVEKELVSRGSEYADRLASGLKEQISYSQELTRKIEELEKKLFGKSEGELACVWTPPSYYDADAWNTSCGHAFVMLDDTPKENDLIYCPYCGNKIVELAVTDENDDEE